MSVSAEIGQTLASSAFDRLRFLLDGLAPGDDPIELQMGELRAETEPTLPSEGWSRYPPLGGTAALRDAYHNWLYRRFGVTGLAAEPTPGSKQAISMGLGDALRRTGRVLMPNPFYPAYQHATQLQGGVPSYYDAAAENPVPALRAALAHEPLAAMLLCHPSSPLGIVYKPAVLAELQSVCASSDTRLLVDECYIDSHAGTPPTGFLTPGMPTANVLVFHTLSKRSAAPGLRSGFVTGDPGLVARYAWANRQLGVSTPAPVCHAAAELWADDARVRGLNARIATAWTQAQAHLADWPTLRRGEAGFLLWLPVGHDETFARKAWSEAGLKVMPGSFLAQTVDGENPGAAHVRVALVHKPPLMDEALQRLRRLKPTG